MRPVLFWLAALLVVALMLVAMTPAHAAHAERSRDYGNRVASFAPASGHLAIVPDAALGEELARAYHDAPEQGYCARASLTITDGDTVLHLSGADSARGVTSTIHGRPGVAFSCPGARVTLHTHPPDACWVSLSDIVEFNRDSLDVGLVQCGPKRFRAWIIRPPK